MKAFATETSDLIRYMETFTPTEAIERDGLKFVSHAVPKDQRCSFCSCDGPFMLYRTKPLTFATGTSNEWNNDGRWFACLVCTILVEAEDKASLLRRTVASFKAGDIQIKSELVSEGARVILRAFWANRVTKEQL